MVRSVLLLLLFTTTLSAQSGIIGKESRLLIGYSGNIPEAWIGLAGGITNSGGVGFYFSIKTQKANPSPLNDQFTVAEASAAGDKVISSSTRRIEYSLAVTFKVSRRWGFYLGGAFLRRQKFSEYERFVDDLDTLINYWLEDAEEEHQWGITGGIFYSVTDMFYVSAGASSNLTGIDIGIGFQL